MLVQPSDITDDRSGKIFQGVERCSCCFSARPAVAIRFAVQRESFQIHAERKNVHVLIPLKTTCGQLRPLSEDQIAHFYYCLFARFKFMNAWRQLCEISDTVINYGASRRAEKIN